MTERSWEEEKYDEVFESVYQYVQGHRKNAPDFTIQTLRDLLETEYIHQGNAWAGRSDVKEITINATIAAYQRA